MIAIPPLPSPADGDGSVETTLRARYEDITQDGRFLLTMLMPGLGAIWGRMLTAHPRTEDAMRKEGILPVLRRLVIVGEAGPFSVHVPVSYEGHYRFAREKDGDRLFLNMWLDARATIATTLGPQPKSDAEKVLVGRIFAEHVVTRPFGPPEQRRVTRLDLPGVPALPEHEHAFEDGDGLVAGKALEAPEEFFFGMMHTDSNQHVNSLVYPRLFQEAVDRRVRSKTLLARAIEARFRKPFFAGDRALLRVGLSGHDAVGTFSKDPKDSKEETARPSTTLALKLA